MPFLHSPSRIINPLAHERRFGFGSGVSSGGWTPAQLATAPSWWLDASALTGLSNDDPCSSFTDRSGNARHFTASTTARATYKTGVLNGLPVLRFDGVDDVHVCNASTTICSLAVVAKYNAATLQINYPGLITGNSSANSAFAIASVGSQTQFFPFPADVTYYKNNVETAEDTTGAAPMNAFAVMFIICSTPRNYTWQLGRDRAEAARRWLGDYAEVIGSSAAWAYPIAGWVGMFVQGARRRPRGSVPFRVCRRRVPGPLGGRAMTSHLPPPVAASVGQCHPTQRL